MQPTLVLHWRVPPRVLGVLNRRTGQGVFPAPLQDLLESDKATVKRGREV